MTWGADLLFTANCLPDCLQSTSAIRSSISSGMPIRTSRRDDVRKAFICVNPCASVADSLCRLRLEVYSGADGAESREARGSPTPINSLVGAISQRMHRFSPRLEAVRAAGIETTVVCA